MEKYDVVIIGGGPAGLAAAISAKENGIDRILILERDKELGGILNQCIHNGFGLHTFQEELTGPEYAGRFIERVKKLDIEYRLNTMVMDISPKKIVTAMNREEGLFELSAGAVILAMGCRERPRGALNIPGYRPAGIFSAGTAQRLVNMEGYMPGREVVILGSGDIGLIMARRMTLEGAKVKVVAELMPYSGGLKRNIVQCLDDYGIPLKLSHTVVDIRGKERLTGVTLAEVDNNGRPIPGTEEEYSCDTLLLSVGLIPENEISGEMGVEINPVTSGPRVNESLETNLEGVFACGNVLHVHDLVDFVSEEAAAAGRSAAAYVKVQRMSGETEALAEKPELGGAEQTKEQTGMLETGGEVQAEVEAGIRADDGEVRAEIRTGMLGTGGGQEIRILSESGVRYTVPERINLERWARMTSHVRQDSVGEGQTADGKFDRNPTTCFQAEGGDSDNRLVVRFRVGNVYRNCYISAYFDNERVIHRKRPIVTPGEMEQITLSREQLLKYPGLKTITIKIEEA